MNIILSLVNQINQMIKTDEKLFSMEKINIIKDDISLKEISKLKYKMMSLKNLNITDGVILTKLICLTIDLESFYSLKTLGQSDIGKDYELQRRELKKRFQENFTLSMLDYEISTTLSSLSNNSYYVGGAVRDACKGVKPKETDFCTDTDIDTLIDIFSQKGFRCKKGRFTKILFLSKKNANNQKDNFEITILKGDNIFEDASERDFTINTGYVRLSDGILLDPSGSFCNDLSNQVLTFGNNAQEKLEKDPVRSLRFMRFVSKGFTPNQKDLKLVRDKWTENVSKIKPEIIRLEMEKMNGLI